MFTGMRLALLSHSVRLCHETQRYCFRIPAGSNVCHRGCAYTVLLTVQRNGVCSAVYGAVHYKEPLKSFDKSRALSRIWASFCRDIAMTVQKAT